MPSMPTSIIAGNTGHVSHHNEIHGYMNKPDASRFHYIVYKSGTTTIAFNVLTRVDEFSGPNSANIINDAISNAPANGGAVGLMSGEFEINNPIRVLARKALWGVDDTREGESSMVALRAGASLGSNPVVRLEGIGPVARNLTVHATSLGTQAVKYAASSGEGVGVTEANGATVRECYLIGGTTNTVLFGTGSGRNNLSDCRLDGNSNPSGAVLEVNAPDQNLKDLRITGAGSGGSARALLVNGSGGVYSNMHVTGNINVVENTLIDGNNNQFSSMYFDTSGSSSAAHVRIRGVRNKVEGYFYNANTTSCTAVVLQRPGAGVNVRDNIVLGTFEGGNQNFNFALRFLGETGSTPANLSTFHGNWIVLRGTGASATSNITSIAEATDFCHVNIHVATPSELGLRST